MCKSLLLEWTLDTGQEGEYDTKISAIYGGRVGIGMKVDIQPKYRVNPWNIFLGPTTVDSVYAFVLQRLDDHFMVGF